MPCPRCQHENPAGVKFCGECGARLDVPCPVCGTANPPGNKFCHDCGGPLAAGVPAAAPPAAPPAPSPQSYTPPHLAERIISSRGALEGERKQVTVLFADLKGSLELLADRDPEEARRLLDPVLERMMDAVHRYEGTVNQVMGDGIMALFGAPLAHEDHAVRACYAALRMQDAVKEYADEVWRAQNVRVQVRVGLNSGEVVVRSIGSDLRMDYTAVGQTTHLAARMEQLASPGTILLAPDTLQLAEGYVQVNALGPVQVRGLSEPVAVYELVGAGAARSRLQAAAARGLTRFVGRDAELETLRRTLEQAGAGHGQIVALVGEPGVGKSRLVWEFSHSHRTQGWLVLESGSVSYGKATSYLPVIDLLKSYCGIEDRDDARRMREKLIGKLLTLDPALQPLLPPLLALLDVPTDDAQWSALDPPQRRNRTLDALKHLLLRESQEQSLLLVFEDLHWIDTETQALLDSLVESLPTARLLLLVNYRPEYEHTWHRKTYYQQLRLDPLPPESADALLGALLGEATGLQSLKRALIERTEGNPFFVEESVRTLIEGGVLAGERGAYRLAKPFESTQVPVTVQAVLAARIDRLAPEDKRLLQAAAVIGKDVPYALLQTIAEAPEATLRDSLARLHTAEFLYETSLFPDLEYTFKHALTHEVAYGSVLQERGRALHAKIAAAIEALYASRLSEWIELLAHHAFRGQLWEKAAESLRQAGAKATARSAHREATHFFEQALDATAHMPASRATSELSLDLLFDLRVSLFVLGENERLMKCLADARAIASALDDERQLARVLAYQANQYTHIGDPRRGAQAGEQALALARTLQDLPLRMVASIYAARAYCALGDYARALEYAADVRAVLQGEQAPQRTGTVSPPAVTCRIIMSQCLNERGEFRDSITYAEEAAQIAERLASDLNLAATGWTLGEAYLLAGRAEQALPLLERGVAITRNRSAFNAPHILGDLGYAYALTGRLQDAIPLLEEATHEHGGIGAAAFRRFPWLWLGEVYLLAGRRADAAITAERVLGDCRRYQERGNEARALRLCGEVAAAVDPPDAEQAESYYRQGLALAEELGMRPVLAHCHLGLGTLYQKVGRDEPARPELAAAIELYRAMEMTFWLEKAEHALTQG